MNMRQIFAVIATLLILAAQARAQSQGGIVLDNANFEGEHASGSCGPATVKIEGIDRDNPHETRQLIPGYQSKVTIRSGKNTLIIGDGGSPDISLENYAKLHCIKAKSGPRLVLAAHCASRYCLPINYTVVDPSTLKVLGQGDDMGCDEACATKALGGPLPSSLSKHLNDG